VTNRTVHYAGFWLRLLAILTDTFLIVLPSGVLVGLIFGQTALENPQASPEAGVFQITLLALIHIIMWHKFGQTPGKKAAFLKVVDASTFEKASYIKLTLRFALYFLSMVSLIGFFIGIFRKDKKMLHDLLSTTTVIRIPKE